MKNDFFYQESQESQLLYIKNTCSYAAKINGIY